MKKYPFIIGFILTIIIFAGCEKNETSQNYDWVPTSYKSLLLDSNMLEGNTHAHFYTIDKSNGFLFAYNQMISPPRYSLYRISNQGLFIEKMNYPVETIIKDLSFLNDFCGYILTEDTAQFNSNSKIFYTENGGLSWTEKDLNINNTITYAFTAIHFSSVDSGIAFIGASKDIYCTIDGGDTWSKNENKLLSNDKYLKNFYVVPNEPKNCFLTIGDSLAYSLDGGFNWHLSSYIEDIYSVSFINKSVGFFASEYNIYKLNNIGEDLTKIYTSDIWINQIEAINENEIYFISNNNVYRSIDNFHSAKIMNIKDPYPNEGGDKIIIDFTLLIGDGLLIDTKGTIYSKVGKN